MPAIVHWFTVKIHPTLLKMAPPPPSALAVLFSSEQRLRVRVPPKFNMAPPALLQLPLVKVSELNVTTAGLLIWNMRADGEAVI